MAFTEEIKINVTENGTDAVSGKLANLSDKTKEASQSQKSLGSSLKSSSLSVLENGGAMGLLNDLTGGFAMQVKDAVEASALFTKSQKFAAIQQKLYAIAVSFGTGAMKLFKLAMSSTGIGILVVAIGLLIANFDNIKKVVAKVVPFFNIVEKVIGSIIQRISDFVNSTNDATRALDKMASQAEKSLKKNQDFLATDGDKFDEYTKGKIEAVNKFNQAVLDTNADTTKSDQEKIDFIKKLRDRETRDIKAQDDKRKEESIKKAKEAQDKLDEIAKTARDKKKALQDEADKKEQERVQNILKIQNDYTEKLRDLEAKTDEEKRNLEEKRALAELDNLKATKEQKLEVTAYYDRLEMEATKLLEEEKSRLKQEKQDAERDLQLNQKQWEIDNLVDPIAKIQAQNEFLEEQYEVDIERLQRELDDKSNSLQEKADAEKAYNERVQKYNQDTSDGKKKLDEEQKAREEAISDAKVALAENVFKLLGEFAEEGSVAAKGIAVAQATISGIEGTQNAFTSAQNSPLTSVFPAYPFIQAGIAGVFSALQIKKILSTPSKSTGGSVGGGGASAPAPPPAPSFNLVQGTGANQIAGSIAGQNKPIQAFVVTSDVTNGQSLDRNIIQNATI
jgi:hypothetical protein